MQVLWSHGLETIREHNTPNTTRFVPGVSVPMTGTLTHHYSVEDSGATLAGFLVDVSLSGTRISPHVYDFKTWDPS